MRKRQMLVTAKLARPRGRPDRARIARGNYPFAKEMGSGFKVPQDSRSSPMDTHRPTDHSERRVISFRQNDGRGQLSSLERSYNRSSPTVPSHRISLDAAHRPSRHDDHSNERYTKQPSKRKFKLAILKLLFDGQGLVVGILKEVIHKGWSKLDMVKVLRGSVGDCHRLYDTRTSTVAYRVSEIDIGDDQGMMPPSHDMDYRSRDDLPSESDDEFTYMKNVLIGPVTCRITPPDHHQSRVNDGS
ncbi:unnamed protein product [Dovyalis caffra]|uniref:Uncharacterized protein n=1 Tax=Dovyalis caffra TaxID=77055 RepID=A0AAV1SGE3_9ROSI|nr:unnamed protein product [Dovyalis caffra]